MSNIRFSPDILKRLGEELVPSLDQAILELVRNAYDADAPSCKVVLENTKTKGGTLTIIDDGDGMSAEDIEEGWLLIGKSRKLQRTRTEMFKRQQVGDKGLGRLSALRSGSIVYLRTVSKHEPGWEYSIEINWNKFDQALAVEDVQLQVKRKKSRRKHGTIIRVSRLRKRVTEKDASRIARALLLLSDPFSDRSEFKTKLIAKDYPEQVQRVERGYLDEARLHLVAKLDGKGRSQAVVKSPSGKILYEAKHEDISQDKTLYKCPAAKFELWEFKLESASFSPKVDLKGVKAWLKLFGGVHFYHRELRVFPYGDEGHDWLDMNLERARNPELRPSTNNSIGRIVVPDLKDKLVQKTDRTGFHEDEEFLELREFAKDVLKWMADKRVTDRDLKKKQKKQTTSDSLSKAKESLVAELSSLPKSKRVKIERIVTRIDRLRDRENDLIREDLQLYRTLATVGTTASAFAHETAPCVGRIENAADQIKESVNGDPDLFERDSIGELIEVIVHSATSLQSMAEMPLGLLAREKRKRSKVDLNKVISTITTLFEPINLEQKISVELDLDESQPVVKASIAAFESILTNLLTNAITSHVSGKKRGKRIIQIVSYADPTMTQLIVRDNGRGIWKIDEDKIWIAGRTTKSGGTGLGLTIVRETVEDLGGEIWVNSPGEIGGADFCIQFNK